MTNKIEQYKFIDELKSLPFIEDIYLFGSRATETNSKFSDIDLAINCPQATAKDWSRVIDIIEAADTLLKIDCVRLDSLNETNKLRLNILSKYKKLYSKNG